MICCKTRERPCSWIIFRNRFVLTLKDVGTNEIKHQLYSIYSTFSLELYLNNQEFTVKHDVSAREPRSLDDSGAHCEPDQVLSFQSCLRVLY